MAISLGQLKILLNFTLGTSETNLLTSEKRTDAINTAVQNILEQYPIPQYVISTNLTFTSGVTPLPDDCLVPLQLNDPASPQVRYERLDWSRFSLNVPQTYIIRWDSVNEEEQMAIYPITPATLQFWYVQNQTDLAADGDEVRFNSWWAKAIAEKAAERLLIDSASFNRAEAKAQIANNLIAKAWQTERLRIRETETTKLQSIFTKRPLLWGAYNYPSS